MARLKERGKKDCRPCERGGSTRATLLAFRLSAALQSKPPHYNARNMVVARATLVDTRRAAIMPFRIATREQGPPSSSFFSSSSSSSFFFTSLSFLSIVIDLRWILRDRTNLEMFRDAGEKKISLKNSLELI